MEAICHFVFCFVFCLSRFWKILYLLLPLLGLSGGDTRICRCWEGYRVDISENGAQCAAINQFHIMPCNMIMSPKCKCSGRVSNILKDRTGTWCTRYKKGKEFMRWPCENVEEWDNFFRKHPDFI